MACKKKSLQSVNKYASKAKFIISLAKSLLICYEMRLLVGFPDSALVDESGVFLLLSLFHSGSPHSHITWGMVH
jgi:hypothetical protein